VPSSESVCLRAADGSSKDTGDVPRPLLPVTISSA